MGALMTFYKIIIVVLRIFSGRPGLRCSSRMSVTV